MKAALVSLDQKWEDKDFNLSRCTELTANSAKFGADIVIFPEMTLTGFTMNTEMSAEDPRTSPSIAAFSTMARQHKVALVAGVVLRHDAKAVNSLVAFRSDGTDMVRYDKMHPFSFAGENRVFAAGGSLATMQLGEWMLGFTICYDLRFPELYTGLARHSDVLLNIANWPKQRIAHWRTLLKARAIENQAYVIGVNRIGVDGHGLEYESSSTVVTPNGEDVKASQVHEEISIHELDRQAFLDFRRGFPTRQDRQPDLYRALI